MTDALKERVQYCFGGERAIGRGIFHLPDQVSDCAVRSSSLEPLRLLSLSACAQDPLAPPKYVSVRSQQVISSILVFIVFLVNVFGVRIAIFTNDVCDGAGRIFVALLFLSIITSAIMTKVGYHLGFVMAAAEYLPNEFDVEAAP